MALRQRQAKAVLHGETPALRVAAIRSMGNSGDVAILIQALHDPDADVRMVAAQRLGFLREGARKATMPLIQAFKDPHIGVRQEAAWALADIGADAVPYLAEALADPDPRVRKWITRAMLAMTNPMMGRAWSPEQVDKIAPAL
jgi:HEAT repeat protein